jgi:anti-anti-sigma regulatory factor
VFALGVRLHDPAQLEHGARLWWMTVVATVAMGVQNATITRISCGVVRTTHLTGIVTDLGHESAQLAVVRWMFGRREADSRPDARGPSFQRLLLLAGILGAFIAGGVGGALVYREFPQWSMLAPVALLAWIIVQDIRTPICEIEEARLADCSEVFGDAYPASADVRGVGDVVVFRVISRGGGREPHLPDLAAWLESLPAEKRVVILDLGRVRAFGPLAAGALAAMSVAAGRLGRRVVVAGLDAGEIATINALSRADLLNERNSAPDLGSALRVAAEAAADALAEERTTARRPTSDAARPRG